MTALPVVGVWEQDGATFRKVGQIRDYTTLSFIPTQLDLGSWALTAPYEVGSTLTPGRLVTIDWRGVRTTWLIGEFHPSQDENSGTAVITVSGTGAKGMLGWCLCWPDATNTLDAQPTYLETKPAPYVGDAETQLRLIAALNFRDRYGAPITCPSSQGRGSTVKIRPKFDNLFELMQTNAKLGGVDFDIGLENVTATTAKLYLRFTTPEDKSKQVRLTTRLGTIAAWEQVDTAPTATAALVGYGDDITDVQTTLAADISSGATTITVKSSANFPVPGGDTDPFRVVIEDEALGVTHISGKTWTVVRGVGSTTAAAHTEGDPVRPARHYKWPVTTASSEAYEAVWGRREVFVAGPDSRDQDEIDASGHASLSDGAESRALSVTAAEADGMQAFIHYNVGTIATAEVATGATAVAPITSIEVTVDADTGISVKPTFGNPGSINSTLRIAQIIRALARRIGRGERG